MTRKHGKDAVFKLDDSGGTLRTLTSYVDGVSGLPGARSLSPVTAFGDQGEKSIPGTANIKFTVKGSYDPTATTGPNAVIGSLRTATATASFEYGPGGGGTGDVKFSGEAWLEEFTIDAQVGGAVPFSATFQVDGTVTEGLFS